MAIYLGSNPVIIDQILGTISPYLNKIINGTISAYENSRVTTVGSYAFYFCSSLTTVSFPNCTTIGENAFDYCYSLSSISFPVCTSIGSYAFTSCYNLISLNLTGVSSVPTLFTSVFVSTPIGGYSASAGGYGSVYVPASLYSDFIVATNWSSISARIISI